MPQLTDEQLRQALEGQVDILTPAYREASRQLEVQVCPSCGAASTQRFIDPARPFLPGAILPNWQLRCQVCRATFAPITAVSG